MRQLSLFEPEDLQRSDRETPAGRPTTSARALSTAAPLSIGMSAVELQRRLGQLVRGALRSLVLTDNRSRIISARNVDGGLEVRIHRSFLHASPDILKRVAEFVNGVRGAHRQKALAVIREHFERHREAAPPRTRRVVVDPVGRYFDLQEIFDDVNRRYFDSRLDLRITWGRMPTPRRRRRRERGFSLRLGTYQDPDRLIRIHRALDREDVPRYVVESVVYHEMLHAEIPPVVVPGRRRQIHPPEFRHRELEFEHHRAAEDWLAENLARLAGFE